MLFLVVVGCVNQSGVIKYNTEPNVTFTGPANGSLIASHTPVTFTANVSDSQQPSSDLDYYWSIIPSGTLDASKQIIAGETVTLKIDAGFDAGEWTVSLLVIDADGAEAEDTLTFVTQDYYPPTVFFESPIANARYAQGLPIAVTALVGDQDQNDLSQLGLTWGGIASGNTAAPVHPDSDGYASFTLSPPDLGFQTLSLQVLDDDGASGVGEVVFEVVEGDLDGDGYLASDLGGDDCEDDDAAIHPGADEICDGLDNDCDGEIDEDPDTYYQDNDEDGFGDASLSVLTCSPGVGLVLNGSDCEDGDATIFPGAGEYCNGVDDDCDGIVDDAALDAGTWYLDGDGDGFGDGNQPQVACEQGAFSARADDCEDGDALVYPGASEICNGVDDDCDGVIDPATSLGTLVWYEDGDGDGFGDGSVSQNACSQPLGYVSDQTDCNDGDGLVYPGASEFCNGYDDSCDGVTDEASAVDAGVWYQDGDYDGYGDAAISKTSCSQPSGYVSDDQDCDDTDFLISPAEPELCDGVDNDCNGVVDENTALDVTTWYLDRDGDLYGDGSVSVDSCFQPSGFVDLDQDCDDRDASINPDAVEVCDSEDNDCDGTIDPVTSVDALTWYRDQDGDSYGDVSSPTMACTQPASYVANASDCDDTDSSISPAGSEICNSLDDDCDSLVDDADSSVDTSTGQAFYADGDGDLYGDAATVVWACLGGAGRTADATDCDDTTALAHPGLTEICNDGFDNDCDGTENSCGWSAQETLEDYSVHLVGESSGDALGGSYIQFGTDDDGDGTQPILVGATGNDAGGTSAGAVYWLNNPARGILDIASADMIFTGEAGESIGSNMEAFDLDEDGITDLAVGIPLSTQGLSSGGAVQLLFAPTQSADLATAGGLLITGGTNNLFGSGLAAGDMDADGVPELAVGAGGANNNYSRIFVFEGPFSAGTLTTASAFLTLTSNSYNTGLGNDMRLVDVDGDGYDDLVATSPDESRFYTNGGAIYVFTGPITGNRSITTADGYYYGSSAYHVGMYMNVVEDSNQDGYPELVVGSSQYSVGRGQVWLVHFGNTLHQGAITQVDYASIGNTSFTLGIGPVASGDMDEDGTFDLVVGAPGHDGGALNAGAALVYYDLGSLSGTYTDSNADITFTGVYEGDTAGTQVASGDADGDGRSDILVAAPGEDSGGTNAGSVYLIWAPNL